MNTLHVDLHSVFYLRYADENGFHWITESGSDSGREYRRAFNSKLEAVLHGRGLVEDKIALSAEPIPMRVWEEELDQPETDRCVLALRDDLEQMIKRWCVSYDTFLDGDEEIEFTINAIDHAAEAPSDDGDSAGLEQGQITSTAG